MGYIMTAPGNSSERYVAHTGFCSIYASTVTLSNALFSFAVDESATPSDRGNSRTFGDLGPNRPWSVVRTVGSRLGGALNRSHKQGRLNRVH